MRSSTRSLVDVLYEDIVPRLKVPDVYKNVRFVVSGKRFWRGACPLHQGQDANFSVNVETLSWTCFSHCGHGSVVSFLNDGVPAKGERFREIVADLARKAGVDIEWKSTPDSPEVQARLRSRELLEGFAVLTQRELNGDRGSPAVEYLVSRGFPADARAISRLGLGFLPSDVNLRDALKASGFELSANGLDDPRWQRRIIIPWRNGEGHVATFLGRATELDASIRYLYLRGAHIPPFFALERIRTGRPAALLVVESPLDAVLLVHHGIDYVVAVGSTLLTAKHVETVREHGIRTLILALDDDGAGRDATDRFIKVAAAELPDVRLHIVPSSAYKGHKDPGELVAAQGTGSLPAFLDDRMPVALYEAAAEVRGVSAASPVAVRRDALDRLSLVASKLSGSERLADLADMVAIAIKSLGYPEDVVRHAFEAEMPKVKEVAEQPQQTPAVGSPHSTPSPVRELLTALYRGSLPSDLQPRTDEEVWQVVDEIDGRLAFVLSSLYGRVQRPMTLDEVAVALAAVEGARLSRERIRQLREKALRRLRSARFRPRLLGGLKPIAKARTGPRAATPASGPDDPSRQSMVHSSVGHERLKDHSHSIVADLIVQTLEDLRDPVSATMLVHLLRGSAGPATSELVRLHSPRHAGALAHLAFPAARDLVEIASRADPRIDLIDRRVSLAASTSPLDREKPVRQGQPWTRQEQVRLFAGWTKGLSVGQLATALGRSPGGVAGALVRYNVVESRDHARARDDLAQATSEGSQA